MITSIIIFLATCNTIFSFPLDKIVMFFFVFYCIYKYKINKKMLLLILGLLCFLFLIYTINVFIKNNVSLLLFFPIIGVLFVYYISKYYTIQILKRALCIHFVVAIFFLIRAYLTRDDLNAHFLYDKGLPFLAAPMGYTATVQTFGTLLLSYIILSFSQEKNNHFLLFFVFVLFFSTFNRASYGNLLIFIVLNNPLLLIFILLFIIVLFVILPKIMISLLGTFNTIASRIEALLEANSAILGASIFNFFLGHSNTLISGNENINVIENGIMQLLFTYGFIFYAALLCCFLIWICFIKTNTKFLNKIYIFYIIIFAQIFTHEYFSTTLYIILSSLFLVNQKILKLSLKPSKRLLLFTKCNCVNTG